jgi:hypothetical protein
MAKHYCGLVFSILIKPLISVLTFIYFLFQGSHGVGLSSVIHIYKPFHFGFGITFSNSRTLMRLDLKIKSNFMYTLHTPQDCMLYK